MLRLIGWVIKTTLFAALVLVAANLVQWNGKTVNDQIRSRLSHAERAGWMESISGWSGEISRDADEAAQRQRLPRNRPALHRRRHHGMQQAVNAYPTHGENADFPGRSPGGQAVAQNETEGRPPQEKVSPSERQKLRALIQELNSGGGSTDSRN